MKEKKVGDYYKICVNSDIYKYPIYTVFSGTVMNGVVVEYDVYNEILTGLPIIVGSIHPALKARNITCAWNYCPYKTPDEMAKKVRENAGENNGLYFDDRTVRSKISQVTAKQVKDFYTSMNEKWNANVQLSSYLSMLDLALENQEKIVNEILKEETKKQRFYHYNGEIFGNDKLDAQTFVNKLLRKYY